MIFNCCHVGEIVMTNYCRITAVLKVETDIIAIIAVSPVGQVVIMYVEFFTIDVIVLSVLNVC